MSSSGNDTAIPADVQGRQQKHDYESEWLIPMDQKRRQAFYDALGEHRDFPSPGILFQDFFPIFLKPAMVRDLVSYMASFIRGLPENVDAVVGLDARGFVFGPILAMELNIPFLPVRKKGKLPGSTVGLDYELEYGKATIELQEDAVKYVREHRERGNGQVNVIIVDDLLATGGTMGAAAQLAHMLHLNVLAGLVVIELPPLKGREALRNTLDYPVDVYSVLRVDAD